MDSNQKHDIIVIGASAGGLDPLKIVLKNLPENFPASIFISKHIPDWVANDVLLKSLESISKLPCQVVTEDTKFQKANIYIAPPDNHLLLGKENMILLRRGARENGMRPAIDPLFRSAAAFYGPRVVGVVLAGLLNDGSAGFQAITRCGGITIVQNPDDALYPEMPQNALQKVEVDYRMNANEIASVLQDLSRRPITNKIDIPKDIIREAEIAASIQIDIDSMYKLGELTPFCCPDCGGALWEISHSNVKRYRCHTGHAFTLDVLLKEQAAVLEQTLWVALRFFDERKTLLQKMKNESLLKGPNKMVAESLARKINEIQLHIDRIRNIIITDLAVDITDPASALLKPPSEGVPGEELKI